eukprot:scaffold11657_cov58-Phaeocystis_antarctica.AAC.2
MSKLKRGERRFDIKPVKIVIDFIRGTARAPRPFTVLVSQTDVRQQTQLAPSGVLLFNYFQFSSFTVYRVRRTGVLIYKLTYHTRLKHGVYLVASIPLYMASARLRQVAAKLA